MRRRVYRCVAAVAVLLAIASCGSAARKARAESPPKKPQSAHTPVVMFLGDSYTTGRIGQIPEQTYAADTARILGWQVIIGGYRGTGFVAKGHIGKAFAALFDEQFGWRPAPDLIIVSGGHNDSPHQPAAVAWAARQLLAKIQLRWPKTHILLMGPMWGGDPKPNVLAVADTLRGVAEAGHVPFVDPLRERWITGDRDKGTGNAPRYILPDATHPTAEGAHYIAALLVADLRRLKLAKP
jgi:lysophospholipase L1-like esterase